MEIVDKMSNRFDEKYVSSLLNEDDIIDYMNRYFAILITNTRVNYCELIYEDNLVINYNILRRIDFVNRLENCEVMIDRRMRSISSVWLKSLRRRKIDKIVFHPYTINEPNWGGENILNMFGGFRSKVRDDRYKLDYSKINPILRHIYEVWCDEDIKNYEYIMGWLAHLLQYPEDKLGVCLVLKSVKQGAGKSMIVDFLRDYVLGSKYCRSVRNLESIFSKFNGLSENMLLTCCEEVGSRGGMYKNSDQLKEIITGRVKMLEKKFMDSYLVNDYERYIFCSNNDWIVKVDSSDRRFMCLEVSNRYVGNYEYFRNLVDECFNDECGELFMNYLLCYDLRNKNLLDIPMTKWKSELMLHSIDPVLISLKEYLKDHKDDECRIFPVSKFYEYYEMLGDGKYKSIQSYNRRLQKYLSGIELRRNVRMNGCQMTCYMNVTINELENKLRDIIGDII